MVKGEAENEWKALGSEGEQSHGSSRRRIGRNASDEVSVSSAASYGARIISV